MRISWRLAAALLGAVATLSPAATQSSSTTPEQQYQVVTGDSLWDVAEKYGANVDELVKLNNLTFPDLILPGDVIKVPSKSPSPLPSGEYVVQPGDTLSQIAIHFDVSLEEMRDLNAVSDIDLIIPGQHLRIPSDNHETTPQEPLRHPPEDPELDAMFSEFAAAEGLNPGLLKAVSWLESGWQQEVVSPAGAVGFMQITPVTSEWLETAVFGEKLNEDVSTYDNLKMGARYLRILLDVTGDEDQAIASYYQGYGTTLAGKMYEETTHYVKLVRAIQERYWPANS